ncbi:MAG: hypothetical protein KDK24_16925 [Pseudooceanicola sp.]|nr:hypothetical protein [Pseudooceanicola sp.]
MNNTIETELSLADEIDEVIRKCEIAAESATSSVEIRAMLSEAEALSPQIEAEAERLRREVLEAVKSREELALAKIAAENAELDAARVDRAKVRLTEALATRFSEEAEAQRQAAYDAAHDERNAVARRYMNEAPALIAQLVSLADAVMLSNAHVDAVNADLPEGAERLQRVEGFCGAFHDAETYETAGQLSAFRLTQMVLPDLKGGVAWPPVQSFDLGIRRLGKLFPQIAINLLWRKRHG